VAAPVVTITAPVTNTFVKSFTVVNGKATEANLARVDLTLTRKSGASTQYWGKRGTAASWGTDVVSTPAPLAGSAPNRTWLMGTASLPAGANLADGIHTLTAVATDSAGRTASSGGTSVTVDKTVPVLGITSPLHNSAVRTLLISGTVLEANLDRVDISLARKNGTATQYWAKRGAAFSWGADPLPFSASPAGTTPNRTWAVAAVSLPTGANLVDGVYTIGATATDKAGNASSVTVTANLDRVVPVIAITEPKAGSSIASLAKVGGTATDNVGGTGIARVDIYLRRGAGTTIQYWADRSSTASPAYGWGTSVTPLTSTLAGSVWSRTTNWPTGTNLPAATYVVFASAYDKAGNSKAATAVSFTVAATPTPVRTDGAPDQPADVLPAVANSSVVLSSARVTAGPAAVVLTFTGSLGGSSTDPARYIVRTAAGPIEVQSVQLNGNIGVSIGLAEGSLHAGEVVFIGYELRDAAGLRVGGSVQATTR